MRTLVLFALCSACATDRDRGTACIEGPVLADAPLHLTVTSTGRDQRVLASSCLPVVDPEARTITVHTSVRYAPDPTPFSSELMLILHSIDCETVPLAQGEWTVVFGEDTLPLTVPDPRADPGCVDGAFPTTPFLPGDDTAPGETGTP